LARAPAWHAGGSGFESPYLHHFYMNKLYYLDDYREKKKPRYNFNPLDLGLIMLSHVMVLPKKAEVIYLSPAGIDHRLNDIEQDEA
jgi:hypothetical protein